MDAPQTEPGEESSAPTRTQAEQEESMDESLRWIANKTPVFGVSGDDVQVLHEPSEFYDVLKEQARRACRRIVLASLYLGTGPLERDLVATIQSSVRHSCERNEKLQVEVLLDFTRGSRGADNSRTVLLPLLKEFDSQVQVSLYHSPDLRGILKRVMPERWNEVVGLTHLKVYLFDDNLIMSGANLSDSYFTNRQDRYILIRNSPQLANFFHHLVRAVSGLSFQLQTDNSVLLSPSLASHPYSDSDKGQAFRAEGRQKLEQFSDPQLEWRRPPPGLHQTTEAAEPPVTPDSPAAAVDTWVYPLLQMPPFSVRTDELLTRELFKSAAQDSQLHLASGYFNLTDDYMDVILRGAAADFHILTASPEANGFFNGAGVSGAVPDAYTFIAKKFTAAVEAHMQEQRVSLHEYSRPGWTFHCKGLWHYLPAAALPFLTIIGSSNFGYRSVYRDLEAQIVIATRNEQLQKQLHCEQKRLYARAARATPATFAHPRRGIPLWVTYVTGVIRKFF